MKTQNKKKKTLFLHHAVQQSSKRTQSEHEQGKRLEIAENLERNAKPENRKIYQKPILAREVEKFTHKKIRRKVSAIWELGTCHVSSRVCKSFAGKEPEMPEDTRQSLQCGGTESKDSFKSMRSKTSAVALATGAYLPCWELVSWKNKPSFPGDSLFRELMCYRALYTREKVIIGCRVQRDGNSSVSCAVFEEGDSDRREGEIDFGF